MKRASVLHRFAMSVLVAGALLAPVATGCGDGNGLVGGDCASGYAPCGGGCCPESADASNDGTLPDGESDASDASDALEASETSLTDGFNADRIGPGTGDGGDGGGESDSGTNDGTVADGSESDTGSTTTDASSQDSAADVAETGPLCMPPLVDCGGVCVDTTSDPFNCGDRKSVV